MWLMKQRKPPKRKRRKRRRKNLLHLLSLASLANEGNEPRSWVGATLGSLLICFCVEVGGRGGATTSHLDTETNEILFLWGCYASLALLFSHNCHHRSHHRAGLGSGTRAGDFYCFSY